MESALRTKIGQFSAEELYTTRHEIITQIVVEALGEASDRYVVIDDVIIRQISLPKLVEQSIQAKIMQKHYAESFVFRLKTEEQEAKRKKIEAEGISRFNTIVQGSITPDILKYKGIQATQELADSENSKIIVIGNGPEGLPIILGSDK